MRSDRAVDHADQRAAAAFATSSKRACEREQCTSRRLEHMVEIRVERRRHLAQVLQPFAGGHAARRCKRDCPETERLKPLIGQDSKSGANRLPKRSRIGVRDQHNRAPDRKPIAIAFQLPWMFANEFLEPHLPKLEQSVGARLRHVAGKSGNAIERRLHDLAHLRLIEQVIDNRPNDRHGSRRRQRRQRQLHAREQLRRCTACDQQSRRCSGYKVSDKVGH